MGALARTSASVLDHGHGVDAAVAAVAGGGDEHERVVEPVAAAAGLVLGPAVLVAFPGFPWIVLATMGLAVWHWCWHWCLYWRRYPR